MTLDESKAQCYSIMSSRLHLMRDLIEDPAQLKTCGYKSLEHALTSIVRLTVKDTDAVIREWEKANPL